MPIIATLQDARRPRCVDSQFPVDPRATHGAPRRDARAATRNSPSIPLRGWLATSGGSRLGLLYSRRDIDCRVVGLKRPWPPRTTVAVLRTRVGLVASTRNSPSI